MDYSQLFSALKLPPQIFLGIALASGLVLFTPAQFTGTLGFDSLLTTYRAWINQIILSVKAGKLHAPYVRDLRGVVEREKAQIGVLLALDEPTKQMRAEAASAGFYESPWGKHPRLQILTVGELLDGRGIDYPRTSGVNQTFKRAPKTRKDDSKNQFSFEDQ